MFSKIAKPGMFGLGMVPKKNFLAYAIQFIFLIIRHAPGNVVMAAINICGKSSITGDEVYGIRWKYVLAFIFLVFFCLFLNILFVRLIFNNIFTFLCLQRLICVS